MKDYIALLLVRAFEVNARIEGMKAENESRRVQEKSPAYCEDHFFGCAREMESIAQEMRENI